jgi:ABC-type phosphate transport system ATPase subunit
MNRYGLLEESQNKLDYVLALTVENFLLNHKSDIFLVGIVEDNVGEARKIKKKIAIGIR